MNQTANLASGKGQSSRILLASFLSLFLLGSYFFNLLRNQLLLLQEKQTALEAIKAIAVPGTSFLNTMGSGDIFKSSIFFLIVVGTLFLVFLLSSLLLKSRWKRAVYLSAGFVSIALLMLTDRLNTSFLFITSSGWFTVGLKTTHSLVP